MTMSNMNPKVDFYFDKSEVWHREIQQLRKIVLSCGLTETLKWGVPCYMLGKSNIVLIHEFKEYCAFLFFKGVLLKDTDGILIQQTKNVQSARQIRFTNVKEIVQLQDILKTYIYQAIEIEKAGLKVTLKEPAAFEMAEEFQKQLERMPELKKAFDALTPGRRRAYLLYFLQPKQSKTRESRVEKAIPHILDGKGLND